MFCRIQNVYTFISSLLILISILLNFSFNIFFDLFLIICFILSVTSMLFDKNNKLQIILNILNIFFNSLNSIIILLLTYLNKKLNIILISYILILLLFSILFLFLSNKSIKKDIKIIKSSNRIR